MIVFFQVSGWVNPAKAEQVGRLFQRQKYYRLLDFNLFLMRSV
jgi:hypothetical protein